MLIVLYRLSNSGGSFGFLTASNGEIPHWLANLLCGIVLEAFCELLSV